MAEANAQPTILVVEDDPALALGLRDALDFEGYRVLHTDLGERGLELAASDPPDCMILDLMLPDINGYQVCEAIRRTGNRVPIIMLTARSEETDKIRGLDAGADDYVSKPFSVSELLARVRAILRRQQFAPRESEQFEIGDVTVDLKTQTLHRGSETAQLGSYEVDLLRLLHRRAGETISRDEILDQVWGTKSHPTNRTVDNFVVKLRKKIEVHPERPRHILTVYGSGYKLVP